MSKGPGRIEQACLHSFDICKAKWLSTNGITLEVEMILGRDASSALASSVRRSLAALRRKGVLQSVKDPDGIVMWTIAARERKRRQQRQRRAEQARKERDRTEQEEQEWFEGLEELRKHRDEQGRQIKRLANLLGMLGSEHDGEVLNAARRAEEKRRSLGRTWLELLRLA